VPAVHQLSSLRDHVIKLRCQKLRQRDALILYKVWSWWFLGSHWRCAFTGFREAVRFFHTSVQPTRRLCSLPIPFLPDFIICCPSYRAVQIGSAERSYRSPPISIAKRATLECEARAKGCVCMGAQSYHYSFHHQAAHWIASATSPIPGEDLKTATEHQSSLSKRIAIRLVPLQQPSQPNQRSFLPATTRPLTPPAAAPSQSENPYTAYSPYPPTPS
jgi:hypothetical protein